MARLFLYVLELEGGNFYVGITSDLSRRYEQHMTGSGAVWTSTHKPLCIAQSVCLGDFDEGGAERICTSP